MTTPPKVSFGHTNYSARGQNRKAGSAGTNTRRGVATTAAAKKPVAKPVAVAAKKVPAGTTPSGPTDTVQQRDASAYLTELFKSYGLGSLAPVILDYVQQGYSADTVALKIQDTQEYKTRFAGNEARRKAGLSTLSPAEYLSTEAAYGQVMRQAGMPSGFYDDPADFAGFIGNNTSVSEIQDRVNSALSIAKTVDPLQRDALAKEWGMSFADGDIAAFVLDQKRALPVLQKQVDALAISAAAQKQGLDYGKGNALSLADAGVTGDQARQAYGQIAQTTRDYGSAAHAVGMDYGQTDAEQEALLGLESAARKRKTVEGTFNAYANQSGARANKGSLSRDSSGSY